ncbi:homoserine kinase [Tessaracoccus sp. MC1627]|uniref:homoserine kinase n=1 Tax=Tessaracoccus sp. MC1627 TaxID=2760312 RepID=UPI001600A6F0|nr:homoserine kinase [Tessaracoccus sp. MC1627]MBB1513931.1 homoserine kinase [Tessaracoccus sp. MC1627]
MTRLTVRVPATTANLGSGFDCVGMAFDWFDELTLDLVESPVLEVVVTGEGADGVPLDDSHLVISSLLDGLAEFGVERPAGMRLTCRNTIPHSRGLGSSAAAIVAGLTLAWGIARPGEPVDRAAITRLATFAEGHPDNAGAAVWGGAILAWAREGRVSLVQLPLPEGFEAVAFVPDFECRTDDARRVLPETVARADAVAQAIAAAALPLALTLRPDLLLDATADLLHQQYRADLMRPAHELMLRLRAAGVPAAISGAGPTVIAVGLPEQLAGIAGVAADGFEVRRLVPAGGVELTTG